MVLSGQIRKFAPIVHLLGKRRRVYPDFGMGMRAENLRAFRTDRPVTKCGSFGGTRSDADVLGRALILREIVSATMRGLAGIGFVGLAVSRCPRLSKVSVRREVSRARCRRLNLGKKDSLRYSG
jgi:hypothetical protein